MKHTSSQGCAIRLDIISNVSNP